MSFACPCGCDLRLSSKDAAMERWLEQIAGTRTGDEMRINLAPQIRNDHSITAPEPTTTLECTRCGADVEALAYIADFLDRNGMDAPDCERCHGKRAQ